MTHRALAQEGPDLRREDISISPPRRRRHRHKGLAPSRSNAVEDSRLGRLSHWPVLPRPQLAGFQVSTEGGFARPATQKDGGPRSSHEGNYCYVFCPNFIDDARARVQGSDLGTRTAAET